MTNLSRNLIESVIQQLGGYEQGHMKWAVKTLSAALELEDLISGVRVHPMTFMDAEDR